MTRLFLFLSAVFVLNHVTGGELPFGYEVFEKSVSPDGKLIIGVPKRDYHGDDLKNFVVHTGSNQILAPLIGVGGRPSMNHMDVEALWSSDSRNLIWIVQEKWGPCSVIFFQIQPGDEVLQIDLREAAVNELLDRLRQLFPVDYREVEEKSGKDRESYYPDGFTVDMVIGASGPRPPFDFFTGANSNPRGIPIDGTMAGFLTGRLEKNGTISWGDYYVEKRAPAEEVDPRPDPREKLYKLEERVAERLGEERVGLLRQKWERKLEECANLELSISDIFVEMCQDRVINERIAELNRILNPDSEAEKTGGPDSR